MKLFHSYNSMLLVGCALALCACDKDKADTGAAPAQEQKAEVTSAKATPKVEEPKAEPQIQQKEDATSDWELTDERRQAIETAIDGSKDFLVGADFEKKLASAADEAAALKLLDAEAKGKWLLITAPVESITPKGLTLPLFATEKAADEPSEKPAPAGAKQEKEGPSVTVTKIDKFDQKNYEPGKQVALLVQYQGNKQAGPAYDLVAMGNWKLSEGQAEPAAKGEGADEAPGAAGEAKPEAAKPEAAKPAAGDKPAEKPEAE